jgi:hypothetical protein
MSDTWTVVDPAGDNVDCPTLESALEAAAEVIEAYLDCDEWSAGVADVHITYAGQVTHRAIEVPKDPPDDVQEAMEDDPDYRPPYDYYCDYEMQQVAPTRARDGAGVVTLES